MDQTGSMHVKVAIRALFFALLLIGIVSEASNSKAANMTDVYIAQTAAGSNNGSSCSNAYPASFFNNAGNWGSGSNQIGPGTTVHVCGTITSSLTIHGSGTSGNVIEIAWTSGARISVPYGQIININGSYGYLLFDGGTPCGPSTACDAVEAANLSGYASGQTGIIEATANGSLLANQNTSTQAFYGCNSCHDIEIRNLIIRNLYVHSSMADMTNNADSGAFTFQCAEGNSGCAPAQSLSTTALSTTMEMQ